ncbi:MAG: LacI family DNA-binding transcriptional regulator [Jannaschia sp.]
MGRTTIRDVARTAGVSVGTASNALAGKVSVAPALRDRVTKAAEAVSYVPHPFAAGLRRGATRSIGLCLPNLANPFFSELAQQINAALDRVGYDLVMVESGEDEAREAVKLRTLLSGRVDGIFIVPTADWTGPPLSDVPIVVLDRIRKDEPLPSAAVDNRAAAGLAYRHLYDAGHRDILMVVNGSQFWNAALRVTGFLSEAARCGARDRVRIFEVGMDPREIALQVEAAFEGPRPTAIFSANGLATLGTLRALQDMGLKCPGDVSLVAIDDAVWMDVLRPAIDVVRQPVPEIARAGYDIMFHLLAEDATPDGPEAVILPPVLIRRDSVRHLPVPADASR